MYNSIVPVYLRNAKVVLILFALNDVASFEHISKWYDLLNDTIPADTPVYIIGTKTDLYDDRQILYDSAAESSRTYGAKYYEISSLTGQGVQNLFGDIARSLLEETDIENQMINPNSQSNESNCC